MRVAVIGAGKMGLPLAAFMASRGLAVTACDTDPGLVGQINDGVCPIEEPGLPDLIERTVRDGHLRASTATEAAVRDADVAVVIVPALIDENFDIDLSILESVTRQIATAMRPGLLVCYETTVAVGTVRNRFVPLLEAGGLTCGTDFQVCFSPERVKSRLVLQRLSETPKIVGGFDEASEQRGRDFYAAALGAEVMPVGSLEAAEFTKLVGMLYRDVNIALVNQISHYAEAIGMDLCKIIPAANTNGEAHLLLPGIGVGGHCAPVYPWFVIRDAEKHGVDLDLARRARDLNIGQASHAIGRLERTLDGLSGRRVLILGLAFRPQVKEAAYSPAFPVRDALAATGADVYLHDHHFNDDEIAAHGFRPGRLEDPQGWQALVLVTAHRRYRGLDFQDFAQRGLRAVVDGRNVWDRDDLAAAGVTCLGIGW